MKKSEGVKDQIREILIDFKHERISLGDAMRQVSDILYKTNGDFYYRGKIRRSIEYKMRGE